MVAFLLFSLGIVFGLFSPSGETLMAEDLAALEKLVGWLAVLPPGLLAIFILLKNWLALLVSFAFSPLLGLGPILALTTNGLLLGVIVVEVTEEVSLGYLLTGLLPHGVFEIPALLIGEAAALSFGASVFLVLLRKNSFQQLSSSLKKNLRYLLLALLLMVPAAIIEVFITPRLLR